MASSLNIIFLFLWSLQHGGGQVGVHQKIQIQVALANEPVHMTCRTTFPYILEYINFKIHYYRINPDGHEILICTFNISEKIPVGEINKTTTKTYKHDIGSLKDASESGTYYCKAKWATLSKSGNGTFLLIRDKGYREPYLGMWRFLLTITAILAVLSIVGTALLLWKRKMVCSRRRLFQKCPDEVRPAHPPSGFSEPSGSIYTCLDPCQPDVYSVIEHDASSPSDERNTTAESQDVTTLQPEVVRRRSEDYGKREKKKKKKKKKKKDVEPQQETQGEIFDTLYENI